MKKNPDATMSHILENASDKPIAKQTFLRIIEAYAIEVQETRKVDERVIQQMSAHMEKYPYKTQQEIADDFHLSVSYVGRLIRKHSLPYQRKRKKKGLLEARELALCLAKHTEWTHQEIAAHLQVSRETVMKYIKQYHLLYLPKNKKEKKKIYRDALHAFVVAHPDLSILKVAKHFGVSEATMKKRMEKHHIPYRKPRKNGYRFL
ncbi:hypothetical protein BMT55_02020 [Listeria newyorkensis]|uniref:Transposase Synechocystis PCC 6803 domain-containing protein n=1 Tax=Listeria newyorkensis TaxID=1497681 RepID=A0ABX4XRJ8_9LIST|nr:MULTISPECIES: helix-turn-helix domain-containing protein [Listeria]KGL46396.1 hypothetical protein EP56_02055 [Listeriaceae bacterium FSL A5-0209]PNP94288.1 hypothetical protein BMT55_02020 [Listeria newyorkensis]RQW67755.1 HTH domain-containing protein [Listeria sp. SHR_NRA_18]WAO22701.1 HTH domain-containing protein [Listeria newyorkensis]